MLPCQRQATKRAMHPLPQRRVLGLVTLTHRVHVGHGRHVDDYVTDAAPSPQAGLLCLLQLGKDVVLDVLQAVSKSVEYVSNP